MSDSPSEVKVPQKRPISLAASTPAKKKKLPVKKQKNIYTFI